MSRRSGGGCDGGRVGIGGAGSNRQGDRSSPPRRWGRGRRIPERGRPPGRNRCGRVAPRPGRAVGSPHRARPGRPGRGGAVGRRRPRSAPALGGAGTVRSPPRIIAAVHRSQPVGLRRHDGLGGGVLEHPELLGGSARSSRSHRRFETGRRIKLGPEITIHAHCNDDHQDHGHQLLDLPSVQKNPNQGQSDSGGWSGNDSADSDHEAWFQRPSPGAPQHPYPGRRPRSTRRHRPQVGTGHR